nr:hypothetical protein BaRGS_000766 [Batillaria attramentaria]
MVDITHNARSDSPALNTTWSTTSSRVSNLTYFSQLPAGSNSTLPQDCVVLQFSDYVPWHNDHNLISAEAQQFVERLATVWFCPILFLIGGPTNFINMVVFYKQGLKERINVCLFALSLADVLYLIRSLLLNAESIYGEFVKGDM